MRGLNNEAGQSLSDSNQADSGWPFLLRAFESTILPVKFDQKWGKRWQYRRVATNSPDYRADSPGCAADWKMSKFRVSLCRKNGSRRDLNELPEIAILRPFRSGIQVRIPEIIGSWVRRRRAKVDVRLVARSAVCAPEFDIARVSCLSEHVLRPS